MALDVETTIKRQDFGVNWEAPALPGGGPSLADDVTLEFTLQLAAQEVSRYSGMLPCLRCGEASRFVSSVSSAVMSFGRVSWGTITSSRYPRSAAV